MTARFALVFVLVVMAILAASVVISAAHDTANTIRVALT